MNQAPAAPVARLQGVGQRYKKTTALTDITLDIPPGCMVGLIGPDGVGKSSLLALVAGARAVQQGRVEVLGGDMANRAHRQAVCPNIAFMPQGLGKNLYPTLSVEENLQFFARLFGHDAHERRRRIDALTLSTGLHAFLERSVGKLSGGMKQKLGLCCALIHDPALLILDEPTTGVDPLARAQFWDLIARIRANRPDMSVVVATAYMEEAQRFDWLVAMDDGRVLATGTPRELLERTGQPSLESAFIALLPEEKRRGHQPVRITPLVPDAQAEVAIEARDLTMRFGDFVAVEHVNFRIQRGEIFGFLGSNGCGKSTTMKMLTGLLPASEGQAWLFGQKVDPRDMATRRRVGYMSQAFSLYGELTVQQNLELHARLFHVPEADVAARVAESLTRFDLQQVRDALPEQLPLGIRQRLSLAVATVHQPELLILDEPTSGVDPIARDNFWRLMIELARRDKVTIFISTHFMNEAERCDRISLMHAGRVLESASPADIMAKRGAATLEEAFISYLKEADGDAASVAQDTPTTAAPATRNVDRSLRERLRRSLARIYCYQWRESLELQRDPVRGALALLGSLLLMFVMGYGISMDVSNLRFAVLDRDQTTLSRGYMLNLAGSGYSSSTTPSAATRSWTGACAAASCRWPSRYPPALRVTWRAGQPVEIGAWVDGAMPQRAETVVGYAQGMHQQWYARRCVTRLA